MQKIKSGIIGVGSIGGSHIEAVRRIGFAEVAAISDTNYELAKKKADEYFVPKCYKSADELLADPEIQIVHNCTPNYLHREINEKIINAGKHVFSEKPLATSSADSAKLLEALKRYPGIVGGVGFNYRMNPQVIQARMMVEKGDIGTVRLVHGSYLQEWLLYDTDYNWRIEPEFNGPSRVIADIGSHWMETVQFVTGQKITEVCADLVTAIPVRKKSSQVVETFKVAEGGVFEEKEITTEDYGAVMFKMTGGISGVFYVSQISAGHGCYNNFEVNGSLASIGWNQERCDELWIGRRGESNSLSLRDPGSLYPQAAAYTQLAKGHPEGWNDAFKNNIMSFYTYVAEGKKPGSDTTPFVSFEEAHYIVRLTEAILQSGKTHSWVDVD